MARAETAQQGAVRRARASDLFVWLWRLLASAQLAIALLGFLALAGLLAVSIPQIPAAMRDNPVAIQAWLDARRGFFGPFTDFTYRLGLFDVVRAWWFLMALGLLAVSVSVHVLDRIALTWRNISHPRELLPDSFFDRAANRIVVVTPAGEAAGLEALLRRRRFRVRSEGQGEAVYLFADRHAWAQAGGLLTHIAIVLFLAGGLISHFGGYSQTLFIAEGTTDPAFPVSHPDQMQIEVVKATAKFDAAGAPRDYRSELVIFQGGREVARGTTTVNQPFSYGGYRFHQVGYMAEGAAIQVRDTATGNTTYDEVLALQDLAPAPAIAVRSASGAVLLDDVIVPTDFIGDAEGTLITVPTDGRQFWVGVVQDAAKQWQLVVYGRESDTTRLVVAPGQSATAEGLSWDYKEITGLPSLATQDIPGASTQDFVVLSRAPDQTPYLTVLGPVDGQALTLYPNRPVQVGNYQYTFEGQRAFAGIRVRRDPGANYIWLATGLLLAGLLVTFYVPRLRLWARLRGGETVIAAQAERSGAFRAEARRLLRELTPLADTQGEEQPDA